MKTKRNNEQFIGVKIVVILLCFCFSALLPAQSIQSYHFDNSVRINRTDCSSLSQLSVLIPLPETNQYQTIINETFPNGQFVASWNTPNTYIRFLFDSEQLSALDTVFDLTVSFDAILHPYIFDFSEISNIYEYNTGSIDYSMNTGNCDIYILPNHPTINSIAQFIWSSSSDILDYARRCYEYVAQNYSHVTSNTGIHPLEEILANGGGDSDDLTSIYISLLRNKSIPSRHVVTIKTDGTQHVFAEFYLEDYGWIPVDVTYKQCYPTENYFGVFDGNGIVISRGLCLTLEYIPGFCHQCVILQDYDWFYWDDGTNQCDAITSEHIINSQEIPQPQLIVTVSANPDDGGSVTGGGAFYYGDTCTINASTNSGFEFMCWRENYNWISGDSIYTFVVTDNRNLAARFLERFFITVTAEPEAFGTVSGGGPYLDGESCTLRATPATGYDFLYWTKNGIQVSTNANYHFSVHESGDFVAHFEIQHHTITTTGYTHNCGSISGGGVYDYGQTCTIVATVDPDECNCFFDGWFRELEHGFFGFVSNDPVYTFTVTEDIVFLADYDRDDYRIDAVADPVEGGIVTIDGGNCRGDTITVSIIPNENYVFQNWTEYGVIISEEPSFSFELDYDHWFIAHLTHIDDITENNTAIIAYPNPTCGPIKISNTSIREVKIFNTLGVMVKYICVNHKEGIEIDLSDLPNGVYVVQAYNERLRLTRQVVKMN